MARFRFGSYVLDSAAGVLEQGGAVVNLRPKLVQSLIPLVESAPHPVSKDTLLRRIWPDTHVVDSALLRNISELRQRFAADFGEQAVIETVSKHGYRFAIPVVRDLASEEPETVAAPARENPTPAKKFTAQHLAALGGMFLLALALIGVLRPGESLRDDSAVAAARSEQVAQSRAVAERTFRAGFSLYDRWTVESMAGAEDRFRQTVNLEPSDWYGYYGLAAVLATRRVLTGSASTEDAHELRRVSELATMFGPQVAVTHSVRGAALLLLDFKWRESEREIEAGVDWNPKNHVPLTYRGALRLAQGRLGEAVRDFDAALRLKPGYDEALLGKAAARYFSSDFAAAVSLVQEALPLTNKKQTAFHLLAAALGAQDQFAEASEALRQAQPTTVERLRTEAWLAARAGRRDTALHLRTQLDSTCRREGIAFCDTATIDVALERPDAAIASVEESVRIRHWKALFIAVDPLLKPLHRHARWARILAQVGS